ncbi:hypothetical protein R8Z50_23000 [Longispora sp. K20-0274]|uniref:hypothetical protein n=1 Tax=Longispora sp. K20-0274 TaxID=3088255 RepID=UPI00399B16CA
MVFNFGVSGHQPKWLTDLPALRAAHRRRLNDLVGRRLSDTYLMWDREDDAWWADGPVVLDFDGEQLEVNHQKDRDLSITWSTIDLALPIDWGTSDNFQLTWRRDTPTDLVALRGQTLQQVELLEWVIDRRPIGSIDIHFTFPNGQVTIVNAGDENGLRFTPPPEAYRRHSLVG